MYFYNSIPSLALGGSRVNDNEMEESLIFIPILTFNVQTYSSINLNS